MYTKFPFSMERLPRPRGCGCLSLRSGCVVTGCVTIVYSVMALSMGLAHISDSPPSGEDASLQWAYFVTIVSVHIITLVLSALMLVGTLREKAWMMRPWVVFKAVQLAAAVLMFVAGRALRVAVIYQTGLLLCTVEFLSILIWFYMLTIVVSHLRELEDQGAETMRLKAIDDTWYTKL